MSYTGELEAQLSEKRKQAKAMREQLVRYAQYLRRDAVNSQRASYKAQERKDYSTMAHWTAKEVSAEAHLQQLYRTFEWLHQAVKEAK